MRNKSNMWIVVWTAALLSAMGCSHAVTNRSALPEQRDADSSRYVIGSEDVLDIRVWGEPTLSGKVIVRADGMISLSLIRDVEAAGLTPSQLEEILSEKMKEFVDHPNVSVSTLEVNSFRIFVSGYIRTPGVYRLRSETTLLQFIPMAGGFSDWANQKKILIIRREKGEEKRIISNYKKMVDGEVPDLVLKPGDSIIVP